MSQDQDEQAQEELHNSDFARGLFELGAACARADWRLSSRDVGHGVEILASFPSGSIDPQLSPLDRFMYAMAAEWYRTGASTVVPDRAQADRGARVTPPAAAILAAIEPWSPFFLILLPDDVVVLRNRAGERDPVHAVLCGYVGGRWSYLALGSSVEYTTMCATIEMLRGDAQVPPHERLGELLPMAPDDVLARERLGRLVLWAAYAGQLAGLFVPDDGDDGDD